jgi:opacity protein-like surface antigen
MILSLCKVEISALNLSKCDPFISAFSHSRMTDREGVHMKSRGFTAILVMNVLIPSILLFQAVPAAAQDYPRAEVYFGYAALIGFNGSVALNANRWFGVVGDYSYRVAEYYADKPLQTFTAGPRLTLRLIPRLMPFAHALFGGAGSSCGDFSDTSGCKSSTEFAMVLGGGLDVHVNKNMSIRAFQIDKIRTRFGNHTCTYTGVSFGLVARLGRNKGTGYVIP